MANALAGKRGNFDRALKHFSLEFETAQVVMLDESALEEICQLEKEIWIPQMQATREVIRERLRQGHKLLSIREEKGLPGMVGWCYSPFTLSDGPENFPLSFRQFSNCKSCCADNAHSAFIYNVGVRPDHRRQGDWLCQQRIRQCDDGHNQRGTLGTRCCGGRLIRRRSDRLYDSRRDSLQRWRSQHQFRLFQVRGARS